MAEILAADLGVPGALSFAVASLERAPLVLRANPLKTTAAALAEETEGTVGAHPLAVHLPDRLGAVPADLLAVVEGRATPQDEASMRVLDLLAPEPGESILDVCAAPGGKTTAIAERLQDRGQVLAYDRAIEKLPGVRESAARLGLHIVETIEVLPPRDQRFDRVLVDAPCSGLGTLRRHPRDPLALRQGRSRSPGGDAGGRAPRRGGAGEGGRHAGVFGVYDHDARGEGPRG